MLSFLRKQSKDNIVKIEFPISEILKVFAVIIILFLSLKLLNVFVLLFFSFILMAATRPATQYLNKRFKLPEFVAVLLIYVFTLVLIATMIFFISRPLTDEFKNFADNFPSISDNVIERFPIIRDSFHVSNPSDLVKNQASNFGAAFSNAISFTISAFSVVFSTLSLIIISIYLSLEKDKILKFFILVTNFEEDKFYYVYNKIESQLGAWVRGQLFLGFIVGLLTWLGLIILHVKFALPLAVLAGLLEIVPIIGPIISAIPMTLVGLSISPVLGLLTLGLSIVVQQTENHLLVPGIMKRAVGLSPVVTLVSVMIGSKLLGLAGSVIAVPLAAMISALLNIYLESHNIISSEKIDKE